MTRYNFNYLS